MTAAQWMDEARCADADPDLWFASGSKREEAKRICSQCPVTAECRAAWPDAFGGVWGGEEHTQKNVGPSPTAEWLGIPHGTERGYRQHLEKGQIPCDRCQVAQWFAKREREERAKARAVSA
ncbi:hypothetical protein A5742_14275 [Mycolicibacterium fortuitum]|uniref:4Fe-4S Wbl-type domain-containing protein n=1 Tax=Mycolicibacterium fortuitum TaxID=1766 RepID=A0ABD6QD30_MYCFO|nr:WhiB family transcriptional regulator [Mycolicibacterium fortuitum]OMC33963.1 hypothetical protein A5742_14275 [Mycolicibacterium fortuitum]